MHHPARIHREHDGRIKLFSQLPQRRISPLRATTRKNHDALRRHKRSRQRIDLLHIRRQWRWLRGRFAHFVMIMFGHINRNLDMIRPTPRNRHTLERRINRGHQLRRIFDLFSSNRDCF